MHLFSTLLNFYPVRQSGMLCIPLVHPFPFQHGLRLENEFDMMIYSASVFLVVFAFEPVKSLWGNPRKEKNLFNWVSAASVFCFAMCSFPL